MHFIAVLNRQSGAFRTMDIESFCLEACDVFAAQGHTIAFRLVEAGEVCQELQVAADEAPDVLMAGGGDGTISAAAGIAYQRGLVLAVLPAGTMNLFARMLQMPLSLGEALLAIASGEVQAVDVATANGRVFVHQFGVGIHTRLVRIRETLTYRSRIGKIWASCRAIVGVVLRPPRFTAEIRTPYGLERRDLSGINVFNNLAGEGHIPYADVLHRGLLGVYLTKPLRAFELARLAFGVFLGRWKTNPFVSEREVQQVTLRFPKRKRSAQAVVDGELVDLAGEVKLRSLPGALRVVAPRRLDVTEPSKVS